MRVNDNDAGGKPAMPVPAPLEMGGGIKAVDRDRLEARIAHEDGRIAAVGVTGLHDLRERRVVPDRVEGGILIHRAEIGIAVLDRFPEQLERSLGELTTPPAVRAGDGFRCQGKGTGGVIAQVRILGCF